VKIYDHPLNNEVTVIEIENFDENNSFLDNIINGFEKYGCAYPSSSCDDGSEKKVIYLDGRRRSLFNLDDTDMLCDLTVRLAEIESEWDIDMVEKTMSIAEAAGDQTLLERLLLQPPEYFSNFKPVIRAA
jgi:hypothetical protein